MCGIAGIIDLRNKKSTNIDLLKKMNQVIDHRGPDSKGEWISDDNSCGLSFARLAIIDVSSNGSQPMHTEKNNLHIVFNGEIYNHQIIRQELINKGYSYHSATDTESILYGYQEFKEGILEKMLGMWGLAIWDSEKNELFAARDRIGVKPFYYYFENGLFIFASEIKSILEHPEVSKEMNLQELPNYLNFGMSSNQSSLFSKIKKLPSAHYLKLNKNGELHIGRFWSPLKENNAYNDLTIPETQQEILRLLRQAVKDRMMSDVPFGVFLSGGIDSSVNVALMAELMNRPVDTFTVGFKELEEFNELKYARQIAKQFKTNHREVLIDEDDAFGALNKIAWHTDEPNADPVCIPLYFLSKLTRDSGTIVIQVGEGSDEQFIGYPWMMREYFFNKTYWRYFNALPKAMKKLIYSTVKPIFKAQNQNLALDYIRRATFGDEQNWSGISIFSPSHLEDMFNDKYKDLSLIPSFYGNSLHNEARSINKDADYLQRLLFVELKQRLAEILLMRVDKIGMAHSLEARVPFLDHRLVEFTMSIPPKNKIYNGRETKLLLKEAVKDLLPQDIIHRKKQGFAAPIDNWTRNKWYNFTKHQLFHSEFAKLNILNKDYLNNMLELHKSGKKNLGADLYSLIALSLWYEEYFVKKN